MNKMTEQHGDRINLLLVNETRLMGNVIAAALEGEPDINIVGCVISMEDAMKIVRENEVDVALVSTRLPDLGALKLTNAITELKPSTKVLALGANRRKTACVALCGSGGNRLRFER
jgi:DNA-binding NarL/FixJ family response regulator